MIFSWKKAYAIIFAKFQVISSHFDKLPYFTPDFPRYQIMDWDLDKGEILKTFKNEFDWLKMIFSWKKAYAIIFAKFQLISSPFEELPYFTPDLLRYQIMDWDLDKGEILKPSKNEFDWLKMIFSWKKAYVIIFAKFQVISSHFDKLPYFTPDFPRYQIMDWDLDKGETLKTSKNEFDWLKMIFSWKKAYAIIFEKFQVI